MELTNSNETYTWSDTQAIPQIVWLASYPKSGNTWLRLFLSVLLKSNEFNINTIETDGIFSNKTILEDILDLESDYLNPEEIESFKRITFSYLSAKGNKLHYYKIHDAFTFSEINGLPIVPEMASKLAIYLVRNPLDVALSLANHLNITIDIAIDRYMTNDKGAFGKKINTSKKQFYQRLSTWSIHVESWLKYPSFPVHFIRYEDMKAQPFETFKSAVNAIGLQVTDDQIQTAIEATTFEKLKKQEEENGFNEKIWATNSFFFKGQVGRWKEELTEQQIEKIRNINEPMMRHFGYW